MNNRLLPEPERLHALPVLARSHSLSLEVIMCDRTTQHRMKDIALSVHPVSPDESGAHILALFNDTPTLSQIPVVDADNRPIGLIGRWDFLLKVGNRFGYELFANRPVALLMDTDPILVDLNHPVADFVNKSLQAQALNQLTGFIITDHGLYHGVGTTLGLTKALHTQAMNTITELNQTTTELRQANRSALRDKLFISSIIESIPTAIQVRELESGSVILHNRAAESMGLHARTTPDISQPTRTATESAKSEQTLIDHDGHERILSSRRLRLRDDTEHERWELTATDDVTEYRETQQRIERLAHYDNLTGLPNRNFFHSHLKALSENLASPFLLLYIDLDNFKSVNDVYGHGAGDELLIKAATRLTACCRDHDFVARLGGDEFAIIWPLHAMSAEIEHRLAGLINDLKVPYVVEGNEAASGASIGAAYFPNQATDIKTLLQYADMALYRAKALGRCQYKVFDNELSHAIRERMELTTALSRLAEGEGLSLHYQPICCLRSGRVRSYEALARWHHPERGAIPPNLFIRLAEETGLIHQLGERILWMACEQAAQWPQDVAVSVNVSPAQLKNRKLTEIIRQTLKGTGLPAHRLEIEITENVLIDNVEFKSSILSEIRNIGCRISIDDFGTGYSSLSYLWKFPFDKIKIDRSFVQGLSDPTAREIIQAIVSIAAIRSMVIIVEGVETEEQFQIVKAMGCTQAQGYLLGRPSPVIQHAFA
ncbi:EAL domain-containing protein [Acetobacter suratthaniensis]|uniref:EAL domain-containing protein n=1 Tax=Acetobacter suratthaniensis TaxID=1502841 RepID=A0ABS3LIN4_9PROT|nr:EAL domain-containing protein [Acetobacter suratthaniensis]MBO1326865.1 EAL domain-containing protein [Acetobacter suratthaniensis]MCX2565528.1 EAL domain-containing protein [Acetobacter suratthaniensis]